MKQISTHKKGQTNFITIYSLLAIFLVVVFSINFVSSVGVPTLYCLTEGQVIQFSECNPNIEDYYCDSTSCQVCAKEISSGIYCTANDCLNACVPYEEPINEDLPEIELLSPSNLYVSEVEEDVDFEFNIIGAFKVESCVFILNDVEVTDVEVKSSTRVITKFLPFGDYTWSVKCQTREAYNNVTINSETIEFTITDPNEDPEDPDQEPTTQSNITLLSPSNGHTLTGAQSVTFKYNFSDNLDLNELSNCSVTGLGNSKDINLSTLVDRAGELTASLGEATYKWKIECLYSGELVESETRTLTINAKTTNTGGNTGGGGSGGGGSGGGGGGSSKKVIALNTADNETKNNSDSIMLTTPEFSDEEVNKSNDIDGHSPNETSDNETVYRRSLMTGAAIGGRISNAVEPVVVFIKGNSVPIAVISLVVIAFSGYSFFTRKK